MLLKTYLELKKSKYVALNDIVSYNTWIEFKFNLDTLAVSIIEAEKQDGMTEIHTKPFKSFNYGW